MPEQSQGVQAWDRYAYANNNPIRYSDPSGHKACEDMEGCFGWGHRPRSVTSPSKRPDSKIHFPPNPFAHNTVSISGRGLLKFIIGIDVDIEIVLNWRALRERDFSNFDGSINLDGTISGGLAVENAVGLEVYGHDGTVLDQSGFQLVGDEGEIPVNAGGCIEGVCGTALYTRDANDPDNLNGEGIFVGAGADPAAIDLSADLIGGSDWIAYGKEMTLDFKYRF